MVTIVVYRTFTHQLVLDALLTSHHMNQELLTCITIPTQFWSMIHLFIIIQVTGCTMNEC